MRRFLALFGLAVFFVGAGFAVGAAIAVERGWGDRDVQVEVVNDSGRNVALLALDIDTCGVPGMLGRGAVEPGGHRVFRFVVCGEGGYQVRARLDNGIELRGGDGYVENGSRDELHVRTSDIARVQVGRY